MIQFDHVYKKYTSGDSFALDDVTFAIRDGEFVFLIGPSGSGKSTMIKLISGEEKLTDGNILVNGYQLVQLKPRKLPKYRRTLGIVFQDFRLIENRTVSENLSFVMQAVGADVWQIRVRVDEVLEKVGLREKANSYPAELSGGEQQRVSIARALVNHPDLLLADEPTGNLDPALGLEIMQLLEQINREGTTVVVVTHAKSLVDRFEKRVIRLEHGKIISDDRNGMYHYAME